jgi:hypothetical protein
MRNIRLVTVLTLAGVGLLFGPKAASAQGTCIEDVWKVHGNSQELTCTANDVTLSSATNINISVGGDCDPVTGICRCFSGQPLTFTADFRMDLTAQARYDVGFYIATDGDPNSDGALTGQCKATASLGGNGGNTQAANFINLDAAPDVCGDITGPLETAHNPLFVRATIETTCPTGSGTQLRLPFATTWRQTGANQVCLGTGNGTTTNDVFPGSPSKCNTGVLALDIFSAPVDITVAKTAVTTSVPETGGNALYNVQVTNNSTSVAVTLSSLTDAPYGNITQVQGAVTATTCVPDGNPATCEVGGTIAAGGSCSCTFNANVPPGATGTSFPDLATACATNITNPTPVCRSDDASVPYSDVPQAPTLVKSVSGKQCQTDVTYNVLVTNTVGNDPTPVALSLNTLVDNIYGDITTVQGGVVSTTCVVPQTIAAGGNYSCNFVGRTNTCNGTVTDIVQGGATDGDGQVYPTQGVPFNGTASVTVTVTP